MADEERDELTVLVERCAAMDASALRRLYELQAPRLKGLAMRITGSAATAEDVLHDVFLAVWQEAARFDVTRGTVGGWLTMLTRFRALDMAKRDGANGRGRAMAEPPDVIDTSPDALSVTIANGEDRALHACLDSLDPRARAAMTWAFVDGLTHREISAREQVPLGTLKSLIRRSLRDLRRCIDR